MDTKESERYQIREELINFLDDLREYMGEADNNIAYDERDSSQFVDLYLGRNIANAPDKQH